VTDCILIQINVMEIQMNVFVCDLIKETRNGIPFSEHFWRSLNEIKLVIH